MPASGSSEQPLSAADVPAAPASGAAPIPSSSGTPVVGRVRGAEDTPVARAAVTLISLGGRQLGRAMSRPDGSYRLYAPGVGGYVLIASADDYQPQASMVVVGDEPVSYDILLSGTSGLLGIVRSADTKAPVGGALVVAADVRGEVIDTGISGADGTFGFTALVPGQVTLAVTAAGYRPLALPAEVATHGVTRTEIELTSGSRLRGVVTAAGLPLNDARVTLVDAAGNVVASAITGEDGAYGFTDLDGGEYTVTATGSPPRATHLTLGSSVDGHDIELSHPGE
ncbi:collagen binding domain-containing protein [Streptomyces sp. NPDC058457]|uniref:MSCRAMM family protein n=1 Tax=Streptomyces sp. NPDC058457 TaxID=3346507 RepID=UPI003669356F